MKNCVGSAPRPRSCCGSGSSEPRTGGPSRITSLFVTCEGEIAMWAVLSQLLPKRRPHRVRGRGFRLGVEPLEDRDCPSGGRMEWADPTGQLDPTFGTGGVVTSSFSTGADIAYD